MHLAPKEGKRDPKNSLGKSLPSPSPSCYVSSLEGIGQGKMKLHSLMRPHEFLFPLPLFSSLPPAVFLRILLSSCGEGEKVTKISKLNNKPCSECNASPCSVISSRHGELFFGVSAFGPSIVQPCQPRMDRMPTLPVSQLMPAL